MLPDLERVIQLQTLESSAEEAHQRIAGHPDRLQALDAQLEAATAAVTAAQERLDEGTTSRRQLEKDLATVQGRLAKYKDQLLEVKTNREYTAVQHEIATAQGEVDTLEDRILESMVDADDLSRQVADAKAAHRETEALVAQQRQELEEEVRALERSLAEVAEARAKLVEAISAPVVSTFETVAKGRRGVAVAEAREGHCTVCHVRLRPQVFNDVRQNEAIIQCESCQRILYYLSAPPGAGTEAPAPTTGTEAPASTTE